MINETTIGAIRDLDIPCRYRPDGRCGRTKGVEGMNGDTINMQELKELAGILNPDLLRFMELAQNMDTVLMPVKGDKLIFASQAAEVLHVGAGMIYRYVEEGLLRAVYEKYNTTPKENQISCRICGGGVHSGTLCPKYKGIVHHKHCQECEYFISIMWQCRYRLAKKGD